MLHKLLDRVQDAFIDVTLLPLNVWHVIGRIAQVVCDRYFTLLAPGNDRPILGDNIMFTPVPLGNDVNGITGAHRDGIELVITVQVLEALPFFTQLDRVVFTIVETTCRLAVALLGRAALIPSVTRDPDLLFNLRGQSQLMATTAPTARTISAISGRLVVQHKEVALVPVRGVHVDEGLLNLRMVVLNGHEKDAIVANHVTRLVQQICCPILAIVAVSAMVGLEAPWVAHLDQPNAIGELFDGEDGVGVTVCDAILVLDLIVSSARCAGLEDRFGAVVVLHQVPQIVDFDLHVAVVSAIEVEVHEPGGAGHRAHRVGWIARRDMLIVTVHLGEGLLE